MLRRRRVPIPLPLLLLSPAGGAAPLNFALVVKQETEGITVVEAVLVMICDGLARLGFQEAKHLLARTM